MTFEKHGRRYEWGGGFGAIFKSSERGVQTGDVRMVSGELFYAFVPKPRRFRKSEVWWSQPHISAEAMRLLKCRFFGTDVGAPLVAVCSR